MSEKMDKKLRKIKELALWVHDYCIGVGSLSKTKDAMSEIVKILQALKGGKENR